MEKKYIALTVTLIIMILAVIIISVILKGFPLAAGTNCGDITSCASQAVNNLWS